MSRNPTLQPDAPSPEFFIGSTKAPSPGCLPVRVDSLRPVPITPFRLLKDMDGFEGVGSLFGGSFAAIHIIPVDSTPCLDGWEGFPYK